MITKELYLYDDNPDVRLTTYCLDSPELMAMGPRPAVLVLPGGGYFSCSDREAEPVALAFAAMGYHAFVLRYSVYDPKRSAFPDITKDIPLKRACQHPRPVREVGMAMRLIRDHAEAWKVDADRIAVCGFSAGGHNAAMYGAYWNTDLVTEGKFDPIRPAALILGYPLTDYVLMRDLLKNASPMDQTFFRQSNRAFLGGREDDAKFDEVSPARHVTKDFPPTFPLQQQRTPWCPRSTVSPLPWRCRMQKSPTSCTSMRAAPTASPSRIRQAQPASGRQSPAWRAGSRMQRPGS